MSYRVRWRPALLLCLLAWPAPSTRAAEGGGADPASWAPQDALAYVGVPDTEEIYSAYQRTSGYRMMSDPLAREVVAELGVVAKIVEQFKARLAKALDLEPGKLKNPFGGPAALYLEAPREGGAEPGAVVVVGVRDAELMRDYYQRAGRRFRELSAEYEAVPFGSHEIDTYRRSAGEPREQLLDAEMQEAQLETPATSADLSVMLDELLGSIFSGEAMPERMALCLTRDRLIVAGSPDAVKDVLRRESGGSLLAHPDHQRLLREFEPVGQARALINLPRLFEMITKRDGDEAKRVLSMLGFDSLRSVIAHARFDGREYDTRVDALALVSGERSGLVKILTMENREVSPPRESPADSLFFLSINLDPGGIADEWVRMVSKYDASMGDELRAALAKAPLPDGTTIDVRKDVLGNIRGPLDCIVQITRPYAPDSVRFLLTLGHRDKAAVGKLITLLSDMLPLTDREVRGTLVQDLPFGGLSVATTPDKLLFGASAAVDAALAGESSGGLATTSAFQRIAALGPKQACVSSYVDSRRVFEAVLELSRNRDAISAAAFTNPAPMMALQLLEASGEPIKSSQLDSAAKLAPYHNVSLINLATTPDGIHLSIIEMPPGSK